MNVPSIVLFSTFPFHRPRHGGQHRALNIEQAYQRAGFAVKSIVVCDEENLHEAAPGDDCIPFPTASSHRLWRGLNVPLVTDLLVGPFAAQDERTYQAVLAKLPRQVDYFDLHHPWLFPLAERLKTEPRFRRTRCILNTYNVEAPLKRSVLDQYFVEHAEEIARDVAVLESRAALACEICVTVSASDGAAFDKLGARSVTVAANGIADDPVAQSDVERMRSRVPQLPFLLLVASAHPPNVKGFWDCFGDSLGVFPLLQPLVMAGSVGVEIVRAIPRNRYADLNRSRVVPLGILDEADLAAVKALAHGFVLPITYGGGSNIKTAEALFSGRSVVGTPTSFRGFDEYLELPGVIQADASPVAFRQAVHTALTGPVRSRGNDSSEHSRLRRGLLWQHSLEPLVDCVRRDWQEASR